MKKDKNKGFIITYILIFGFVFLLILAGLLSFILSQLRQAKYELAYEQSLHVAESGLDRYKWYLIQKSQEIFGGEEIGCPPSDCADCAECEYELALPGVGVVGKYQLEIDEDRSCGVSVAMGVTVIGWTPQFPDVRRKIRVRYIKPSVAEYSYILNHDVWAGADRIIMGPYHSNGGIRMDATNNSLVMSEQEEWVCTHSYGCTSCPSDCEWIPGEECVCPGVFTTANGNQDFFRIGSSHFDFEGITVDLGRIKSLTQPLPEGDGKGLYFPPSDEEGYHVIIDDRTLSVSKITELSRVRAYTEEEGYHWEYSIISEEGAAIEYILEDCGLIYIEDNVWIEGEIGGRMTLAVANLINPEEEVNAWLKGNIEYKYGGNADGFVLISQQDVLISPDSPQYMDLHGIFIAQTGKFGINYYSAAWYPSYGKKEELNIYGTIVSNGRVGTQWTSGGSPVSGYMERENLYNPELGYYPPPFLPCISEEFSYRGWEEIQ
ncbi:MAG: hypothetical protein U9Q96_00300 [Patescibacteria group bacterium]|nr:hypothetical protein [Patescibacteria group bacterium]